MFAKSFFSSLLALAFVSQLSFGDLEVCEVDEEGGEAVLEVHKIETINPAHYYSHDQSTASPLSRFDEQATWPGNPGEEFSDELSH